LFVLDFFADLPFTLRFFHKIATIG